MRAEVPRMALAELVACCAVHRPGTEVRATRKDMPWLPRSSSCAPSSTRGIGKPRQADCAWFLVPQTWVAYPSGDGSREMIKHRKGMAPAVTAGAGDVGLTVQCDAPDWNGRGRASFMARPCRCRGSARWLRRPGAGRATGAGTCAHGMITHPSDIAPRRFAMLPSSIV